jgi:glycosyltransferase involved in cell wall biosynthesis
MIELREFDLADLRADRSIPTRPTWVLVRDGPHVLGELRFDGRPSDDSSIFEVAHRHLSSAIAANRLIATSVGSVVPADVSIIVCSRNHSDQLVDCLNALQQLDPAPGQILVVDNAPSDDSTRHVVEAAQRSDTQLSDTPVDYVLEPTPGLNNARNTGWRTASGCVVVYIDDDARADRHLVSAVCRSFFDHTVGAVTGLVLAYELATQAQVSFERTGGMRKGFQPHVFTPGSVGVQAFRLGVGTNMAFRRAALEAIGGFDPAIGVGTPSRGGGDLEGLWRVLESGSDVVYQPDALVRHIHRRTWPELIQQHRDFGTSYSTFLHRRMAEERTEKRNKRARKELVGWHFRRHFRGPIGALRRQDRVMFRLLLAEASGSRRSGRIGSRLASSGITR